MQISVSLSHLRSLPGLPQSLLSGLPSRLFFRVRHATLCPRSTQSDTLNSCSTWHDCSTRRLCYTLDARGRVFAGGAGAGRGDTTVCSPRTRLLPSQDQPEGRGHHSWHRRGAAEGAGPRCEGRWAGPGVAGDRRRNRRRRRDWRRQRRRRGRRRRPRRRSRWLTGVFGSSLVGRGAGSWGRTRRRCRRSSGR